MHKLEGWEMWVTSLVVRLCCQNSWKRSPLFSSGSVRRKAQGHPSVWDIFFSKTGRHKNTLRFTPVQTSYNETTGFQTSFASLSSQEIEQKWSFITLPVPVYLYMYFIIFLIFLLVISSSLRPFSNASRNLFKRDLPASQTAWLSLAHARHSAWFVQKFLYMQIWVLNAW